MLSTDTMGVNHVNFALLDLFGYQLPTLCRVGKVINDMFDVKERQKHRIQLLAKSQSIPIMCAALGYHPTDYGIT